MVSWWIIFKAGVSDTETESDSDSDLPLSIGPGPDYVQAGVSDTESEEEESNDESVFWYPNQEGFHFDAKYLVLVLEIQFEN